MSIWTQKKLFSSSVVGFQSTGVIGFKINKMGPPALFSRYMENSFEPRYVIHRRTSDSELLFVSKFFQKEKKAIREFESLAKENPY